MFLVKKLISAWILSPAGLGVAVILGLILSVLWRRRLGLLIAALAGTLLIGLSLPVVSNELLRFVEVPPLAQEKLKDVQAIVILGGGIHSSAQEYGITDTLSSATLVRVRYGAWLAHQRHIPMLVSGGSVFGGTAEAKLMARALNEEFGVPVRWVVSDSRDTSENAQFSSKLLKQEGITRIALVSHAYHLRRASELFVRQGMTVVAAPTFSTESKYGFEARQPSVSRLDCSFIALHEFA